MVTPAGQHVVNAKHSRTHHCRNEKSRPHIEVHAGERFGRNTDDCEVHTAGTAQPDMTPDDGRIPSQFVLPEVICEHNDRIPPRNFVLSQLESAAEVRIDAEHVKEISSYKKSHL